MSIEKAFWVNYERTPRQPRWVVFYVNGARIGSAEETNANLDYMRARYHTSERVTSSGGLDVEILASREGAPTIDA